MLSKQLSINTPMSAPLVVFWRQCLSDRFDRLVRSLYTYEWNEFVISFLTWRAIPFCTIPGTCRLYQIFPHRFRLARFLLIVMDFGKQSCKIQRICCGDFRVEHALLVGASQAKMFGACALANASLAVLAPVLFKRGKVEIQT